MVVIKKHTSEEEKIIVCSIKYSFRHVSISRTELVSSSNVSSFAFKLSTFLYIYTLKITVSKKQDAINRQDEYHHYVSVILNQNFLTFARRKLSSLRSATAYRRRLYFAVLSRLITAAKMYRSPFSTRCSRISFPRFDSIPSIWKEEETSFLSLEARNRRFVRKGVCLCRFVSKIIPLNTE